MPDWKRRQVQARNRFFVEQIETRFLPLVSASEIEKEAIEFEKTALSDAAVFASTQEFGEEHTQEAFNLGLTHWELLKAMQSNLLFSVITTIFHEWEKQLRLWLTEEVSRWCRQESLNKRLWEATFSEILSLLQVMGIDVRSKDYFADLNACRLIVNVFKHGNGSSFEELCKKYPNFLRSNAGMSSADLYYLNMMDRRDYTQLEIRSDDLLKFSSAIEDFWASIPDEILDVELERVPKWFRDAVAGK